MTPADERVRVVAGIVIEAGRVLIARRTEAQSFGLQWEFPGGKVEAGETDGEALAREFREELGIEVEAEDLYDRIRYRDVRGRDLEVVFLRARRIAGEPRNLEVDAVAWVAKDELGKVDFIPANRRIVERLSGEPG